MVDFYEISVIDNMLFLDANPSQKRDIINIGAQIVESFSRLGTSFEPNVKRMRHDSDSDERTRELERLNTQHVQELTSVYEIIKSMREHEVSYDACIDTMTEQLRDYDRKLVILQERVERYELKADSMKNRLKLYIKGYMRNHCHCNIPTYKKLMKNVKINKIKPVTQKHKNTHYCGRNDTNTMHEIDAYNMDDDPQHWLVDSRI